MNRIGVQTDDFAVEEQIAALEALGGGAVASFVGVVRGDDGLIALEIEHYPKMTETALKAIAHEARVRWPLLGLTIVHRHGRLASGDRIVFVGAVAAHRQPAIAAMTFVIDALKTRAPFWKCEHLKGGLARWVDASAEDRATTDGWVGKA